MTPQDALPLVLITEDGTDPAPLRWLAERARIVQASPTDPILAQADALLVRTYTQVNAELLDRAPRLKVVGRGGVGLENIDVPECRRRGIQVVYTPNANTLAVGDFIFAYILDLLRPRVLLTPTSCDPKEFNRLRKTVRGRQLNELTIGIIGMGRVGRRVAHIAAAFGMRILYNDIQDVASQLKFSAASVDKPALLRDSDIVTLHVDMRPGNHHMISTPQLALMKPTSILLNTSRGEVLDIAALNTALREKRLFGAALDVFHPEPPSPDFPLFGLPNIILTAHLAARTTTAMENMSWVVRDVVAVLEGKAPEYPRAVNSREYHDFLRA